MYFGSSEVVYERLVNNAAIRTNAACSGRDRKGQASKARPGLLLIKDWYFEASFEVSRAGANYGRLPVQAKDCEGYVP
jgi:hypothetical protein